MRDAIYDISHKDNTMKCVVCKHGETSPSHVTVTLERPGVTLVVKTVPAQVCQTCGEQYVDEHTTASLLQQAEEAASTGIEVQVRSYVAA